MDPNGIIAFIAIIAGLTVLLSLRGIIETCYSCIVEGSTEGFFSNIWHGCAGNLWVVLGIMVLCIPLFFILKIIICVRG